jgi:uncharacterized protein YjbI with pentapeptide repeats
MKVVKDIEQGLLLNRFGLGDKFYLTFSVMTFFALENPDAALSEQQMWPMIQKELGNDAIFDAAMPKLKAEVLLSARCFAPNGKPRRASTASFSVGTLAKTLNVFGDRFWRRVGVTFSVISDPIEFVEMPLAYRLAFGGSVFGKNPLGRGLDAVLTSAGNEVFPLPNIEDPAHLIGSPADRPDPAGFAPLDFRWPQRAAKFGTYDEKWRRERWPFFPDDMDWGYFNAAPDDQTIDGFFSGGERITLLNMHPQKPLIESGIPRLRQRCFVNRLADPQEKDGETLFQEVKTRIDTLWLFPHLERGVAVFRGSIEVADDEALDVLHVFIATENAADEPKSLERYYEEFKKRIDRSVPADLAAPMEEAKQKLSEAADQLKDLPLKINDAIASNLGDAPLPVRTPDEIISNSLNILGDSENRLAEAERDILGTKAKYGHITKINTDGFRIAREQFAAGRTTLTGLAKNISEIEAANAANMEEMKNKVREATGRVDPKLLKDSGIDPDRLFEAFEAAKGDPWQKSGMRFIEECREKMLGDSEFTAALSSLGIRRYHAERAWLGVNAAERRFAREQWGLKSDPEAPAELIIPAGFVIPVFAGARLERIGIRPLFDAAGNTGGTVGIVRSLLHFSDDADIEGSKKTAICLSAGDKPFIRVRDALEAVLLNQEIGGFCAVAALKNPAAELEKNAAGLLQKASQFLVTIYPDSSEPDDLTPKSWNKLHPLPEGIELPAGKNLFEAKKAGADLWQWAADALRGAAAPDPDTKPPQIDPGEPGAIAALVPAIDAKALIDKVRGRLEKGIDADRERLEKAMAEMKDKTRRTLAEKGIDMDAAPGKSLLDEANPYDAAKQKYAEKYASLRTQLKDANQLTPDIEKNLAGAEQKNMEILSHASRQYEEGTARIAALKDELKQGLPPWARDLLANAGIDPDEPEPLKQLGRADISLRIQDHKPLAGKNLTGADLSGMDLSGVNLSGANLTKAVLTGADLSKADLSGVIANEADFSRSSLTEANMTKGLFQKAKFNKAKLAGADLTQAIMSEADLSGAVLLGAILKMTLLEKAKLPGASLKDARASQGYFLSTDLSGADFSGADIGKAVFLNANVNKANFSSGKIRGTIFIGTKGDDVDFSEADMFNSRILNDSSLKNGRFAHVNAKKACWLRSELPGGDFRSADFGRALVEECDLSGSQLSGVNAKEARLTKSDLNGADLSGANLMFGSLRKSGLVESNLSGANLYGAEFYRTKVGRTRFDNANLKMTKLYKREHLLDKDAKEKEKDR